MTEVERNKETVRRWIEEVWGTGNAELMDELLDASIVDHNPIPGVPPGREGNKSLLQMFHAAFDIAMKLDLLLADGDYVVDCWTASMTHKGEFMGIPATGKQVRKLTEREMAVKVIGKQSKQKRGQHHVRTLSYSPDGKTLASAGGDGVVRLWDLPSGKPQRRLLAPRAWVNTLAFSPDGKTLASADYSSAAVNVWDLATGQSVRQLQVHEYQIAAVAFSPDGKTLATGRPGLAAVIRFACGTPRPVRRFAA